MRLIIKNRDKIVLSLSKAAKAVSKAGIKTQQDAANLAAIHARRLAPKHTGETMRGIRVRKISRYGYRTVSTVRPKGKHGFMQNFWANDKAPWKRPRMFWNGYKPTKYGTGPANYDRGGKGYRFFDRAVQIVQKKYKGIGVKNLKDALSTTIR